MAIMEKASVVYEEAGCLGWLTVNRPESLNALNVDVLQSILLKIDEIRRNPEIRSVAITGAGEKAFVAGADIATMSQLGPRPIADYIELGQRVMREIELLPIPVIAAVNGFALGGGLELALSCDFIIAAETAKLGQPEVNLGIIPGFGGTQRLLTRCGVGNTRKLVYTGDLISADDALKIGLVDEVVSTAALKERIGIISQKIASKAPLAVSGAKEVIRKNIETQLLPGLRYEVEKFLELFQTKDREEGMGAFLQKRAALFEGK